MHKILAYSIVLSIALLNSYKALASNNTPEDEISVVKVQHEEELEPFSSIGRIDGYKKILNPNHYDWGPDDIEAPTEFKFTVQSDLFGVYKVTLNGDPVGIQGISPHIKRNQILASAVTNILPSHQGRGLGTAIAKRVVEIFDSYSDTPVLIKFSKDADQWEEMSLSYIHGDIEWEWGKNGASLKIALKAGYGITCLSSSYGLVEMLYPRNDNMWNESRVNHLVSAALSNRNGANPDSIPHFLATLEDLDFTQDTELSTFYGLTHYIFTTFEDENSRTLLSNYIKSIDTEDLTRFINTVEGVETEQYPQKISTDLIAFTDLSHVQYQEDGYLNFIKEARS
jgi:hypothetical protein